MEIWINPACSKCVAATDALDAAGIGYTVRRYLDDPPTAAELTAVLDRLGLDPWHIVRTGEPVAADLALDRLPRTPEHREQWLAALVAHPVLIQRPILTAEDGTTLVGRDPDSVRTAIDAETADTDTDTDTDAATADRWT